MNKKYFFRVSFLTIMPTLMCIYPGHSQKVSDILEHGEVVSAKRGIFLKLDKDKLLYETGKKPSGNFDPLNESTFFLLKGKGANVFLSPPLNPLNYSTSGETTFTPDAINAEAAEALGSIISSLEKLETTEKNQKKGPGGLAMLSPGSTGCSSNPIQSIEALKEVNNLLQEDKLKDQTSVFIALKSMDFSDKAVTKTGADEAKKNIDVIETHYNEISKKINAAKNKIDDFKDCTTEEEKTLLSDENKINDAKKRLAAKEQRLTIQNDNFITIYVLNQSIKDAETILNIYQTSVKNLKNAYDIVNQAYSNASGEGKDWYVTLDRITMQDDKIATYEITVNSDGYALSNEKQIVKSNKKSIVAAKLKFRKFQRFVPEVSAGIAYTKLHFPKFETTTDAITGDQTVTEAGEEEFKKVNFTSMINFNYYIPNSPLHPFWQIGVGATAGYPIFFTGIGGRINLPSLKRLAISVGFAGSWIKSLSSLKVGDKVSGSAELEKDLKYQFSFPLKPYLGFHYNF